MLGNLLGGERVIISWGRARAWHPPPVMRPVALCESCGETHSPDVPQCECRVCLTAKHCVGCHHDHHDVERCRAFGKWAALTFPAYRDLPPLTVRTDRQPWKLDGDAVVHNGKVLLRVRPERRRKQTKEWKARLQTTARVLKGGDIELPRDGGVEDVVWEPVEKGRSAAN